MSKFERFLLRWIFRRTIDPGTYSARNMRYIFKLIYDQVDAVFYEDNIATRNSFVQEQLDASTNRCNL